MSDADTTPQELLRALDDAGLRATWEAMPPSHRRRWSAHVIEAKKPETTARRIEKVVAAMAVRAEGEGRLRPGKA